MPLLPITLLFLLVSAGAGAWVVIDTRTRTPDRPRWEAVVWGMGTVVALPVFLPMYLLGARRPNASGIWGPPEIFGVIILFAVTLPLVAEVAGVMDGGLTLSEISVFILAQNAGFVLLAAYAIARRYGVPVGRLGLHGAGWWQWIVAGAVVGIATIGVSELLEQLAVLLVGLIEGRGAALARAAAEHAADPLAPLLAGAMDARRLTWVLVLLGVVVPVGEETFFRGVVYGGLRRRWGIGWGVAGSTLLFGAVHQQVIHFLPIAALGLVLAVLYEQTGSLVPAITVHAVNNVVAVLARLYGWQV